MMWLWLLLLNIIPILMFFMIGYMASRNIRVFNYRMRLLNEVHQACIFDINHDYDPQWRHDVMASVSYDEMMLRFWKPLDSFYPSMDFKEPGKHND